MYKALFFTLTFLVGYLSGAWFVYSNTPHNEPPMTRALNACQQTCNNSVEAVPYRVYAGNREETFVECDCQGYGKYDQ